MRGAPYIGALLPLLLGACAQHLVNNNVDVATEVEASPRAMVQVALQHPSKPLLPTGRYALGDKTDVMNCVMQGVNLLARHVDVVDSEAFLVERAADDTLRTTLGGLTQVAAETQTETPVDYMAVISAKYRLGDPFAFVIGTPVGPVGASFSRQTVMLTTHVIDLRTPEMETRIETTASGVYTFALLTFVPLERTPMVVRRACREMAQAISRHVKGDPSARTRLVIVPATVRRMEEEVLSADANDLDGQGPIALAGNESCEFGHVPNHEVACGTF